MFLLHAADDATVKVDIAVCDMYAALKAAGVSPLSCMCLPKAGTGSGLRGKAGKPVAAWPELFLAWGTGARHVLGVRTRSRWYASWGLVDRHWYGPMRTMTMAAATGRTR